MDDFSNKLGDLFRPFSDSVGGYWSEDNAKFDRSNPNFFDRTLRTINPITGFGSALGSLYDYSNQGDIPGMALSALSAMPARGFATVKPKSRIQYGPAPDFKQLPNFDNIKALIAGLLGQTLTTETLNAYESMGGKPHND